MSGSPALWDVRIAIDGDPVDPADVLAYAERDPRVVASAVIDLADPSPPRTTAPRPSVTGGVIAWSSHAGREPRHPNRQTGTSASNRSGASGSPRRSTSCTSATSARLTGASRPAADASRTTAPLRKSISVG